ncbi:hypothetical protein ACFX11_003452 [Malus domestica]
MKNHQARPTGSNAALEADATTLNSQNRGKSHRGHGMGQQAPSRAQGPLNRGPYKGGNLAHKRQPFSPKAPNFKNKGKPTVHSDSTELDKCYRSGSRDHWSHVCTKLPLRPLPSIIHVVSPTLRM